MQYANPAGPLATSPPPTCGVAGQPAGPAIRQLLPPTLRPPASPGSLRWANVARGTVRAGEPTCPRHQPAVTAVDFTALYDHCLASGFKSLHDFHPCQSLLLVVFQHCRLPYRRLLPNHHFHHLDSNHHRRNRPDGDKTRWNYYEILRKKAI
jgi:hypothetical protein